MDKLLEEEYEKILNMLLSRNQTRDKHKLSSEFWGLITEMLITQQKWANFMMRNDIKKRK